MGGLRTLARQAAVLHQVARLCSGSQALLTAQQSARTLGWGAKRPAFVVGPWAACRRAFSSLPPHTELKMPALSPTMAQGNVASWSVKEGDEVAPGDMLAEIETDKATLGWENMDDGFIAKILVPEGAKDVAVGTPLAVLVEDKDAVPAFKDYQPSGSSSSSTSGSTSTASETSEEPAAADAQPSASSATSHTDRPPQEANHRIGPAAQWLLRDSGLTAADVAPSGPRGIITKGDVLAAIEGGAKPKGKADQAPVQESAKQQPAQPRQAPAPSASAKPSAAPAAPSGAQYTDIPNSQIRKIIAQRLLESKRKIPHAYFSATASIDGVSALRQTLKEQGQKVSINDFIIRAVALALQEVPAANAMWDEAAEDIKLASSIDISIAVATDSGLITPIVAKANTKSLKQISDEVRELAGRARANKLKPHEFQGGSFSISNLGMYGIDRFSAIINPPQACIMAVGGTQQRAEMRQGRPSVQSVMVVTLSADERVYDSEVAGGFLEAFRRNIESPVKLLV